MYIGYCDCPQALLFIMLTVQLWKFNFYKRVSLFSNKKKMGFILLSSCLFHYVKPGSLVSLWHVWEYVGFVVTAHYCVRLLCVVCSSNLESIFKPLIVLYDATIWKFYQLVLEVFWHGLINGLKDVNWFYPTSLFFYYPWSFYKQFCNN